MCKFLKKALLKVELHTLFLIFSSNGHFWPSDGPEADRGLLRDTEGPSGRPTPPHADRGPLKPNNVGRQSTPQAIQRSAQDEQGPPQADRFPLQGDRELSHANQVPPQTDRGPGS